jgi:hypothetical protein
VLMELRALRPDHLLVTGIFLRDVPAMAEALEMQASYHPRNYQRAENIGGPKSAWGNLILSKHPLYEGAALPRPESGAFGVRAVAQVQGRLVHLVSAHLAGTVAGHFGIVDEAAAAHEDERAALVQVVQAAAGEPMVLGVQLTEIAESSAHERLTQRLADVMQDADGNRVTPPPTQHLLVDPGWRAADRGRISLPGGAAIVWADLAPAPQGDRPGAQSPPEGG